MRKFAFDDARSVRDDENNVFLRRMMMKKFFALFLVLVTVLSCILVSCDKDGEGDGSSTTSADLGIVVPSGTTAATTTGDRSVVDPGRDSSEYDWTADTASATVYIKVDALNVRNNTIVNDSTYVGTAYFGQSFTRVKYNEQWTVISFNGNECFVSSAYITTDGGSVLFDEIDEKTMYINVESTLNLRTSTYVTNPDGSKYTDNIYAPVKRGAEVVQIGVSKNGNWAKVKYDGKELYCNTVYLSAEKPSDDTTSSTTPVTPIG